MNALSHPDIEAAAIGALLLESTNLHGLAAEDFADRRHRLIFEAIQQTATDGQADTGAVASELARKNQLAEIGGMVVLAGFMETAPPASSLARYAKILKDAGVRRHLHEKAAQIAKIAAEAESAADAVDQAEALVSGLRSNSSKSDSVTITTALQGYFKALEHRHKHGGGLIGVTTGFNDLDLMTCGFQPGDLILVAARPSMGKTALSLNFAEAAARGGASTLVFSLEMSRDQLVQRLLAGKAKVDSQRLRTGVLSDGDFARITRAADDLHRLPLTIDDSSSLTVLDIRSRARRVAKENGLGLIVVDYVGLIRPVRQQSVREREIAEISRSLKALAKELHVPVVVACQLNRALESGAQPRKPVMSDLRESGALEQDADIVLFPWRDAAFCPECRRKNSDCGKGHFRAAEIIVGKQRNGPIGTVPVAWLPELTSFAPLSSGGGLHDR